MSYKEKAIEAVRKMFDIDGYRKGDAVSRRAVICLLDHIDEDPLYLNVTEHGICIMPKCPGCMPLDEDREKEEGPNEQERYTQSQRKTFTQEMETNL